MTRNVIQPRHRQRGRLGSLLESFSVTPNASVPEPGSAMMLSLSASLLFLIGFVRRKNFRCLAM